MKETKRLKYQHLLSNLRSHLGITEIENQLNEFQNM